MTVGWDMEILNIIVCNLHVVHASYYAHHTGNPTLILLIVCYFDEIENYNKGSLPRLKVYYYFCSLPVFTEVETHSMYSHILFYTIHDCEYSLIRRRL